MNVARRGLLGLMALIIPVGTGKITKVAAAPVQNRRSSSLRVSNVRGDIAEALTAELLSEGKKIRIFLDGVEQEYCTIADEDRNYVVRMRESSDGNVLINPSTGEILRETVHGDVKIEIT